MKQGLKLYLLQPLVTSLAFFGWMSLACIFIEDLGSNEKYLKGLPFFFLLQIVANYFTNRKAA